MAVNDRKSFVLYNNYEKSFKLLSMEERGRLITAIFEYANGEVEPEGLSPIADMAFSFIKDTLDRDRACYVEKCEKNAENGKKGGRPRKNISASKTERFFEKSEKADNDNDNDNENDNGNDNGNENENENDTDTERVGGNSASVREVFDTPTDHTPTPQRVASGATLTHNTPTPLSEREREELKNKGIPEKYVAAREERAVLYAKEKGVCAVQVLEQWWREDEWKSRGRGNDKSELHDTSGGKNAKADAYAAMVKEKSYDIDDFFLAAWARSQQELDKY